MEMTQPMLEILPEAKEKEEFLGFSFPLNLQSLANAANGLYLVGHKLPRKFIFYQLQRKM